jgi:hypothetical protein
LRAQAANGCVTLESMGNGGYAAAAHLPPGRPTGGQFTNHRGNVQLQSNPFPLEAAPR